MWPDFYLNELVCFIAYPVLYSMQLGGKKDSRVSQEQEVEDRVVLAEVDQRPAEHPATHGEQTQSCCDQNHIADQRSPATLRHLDKTDDRITHSWI